MRRPGEIQGSLQNRNVGAQAFRHSPVDRTPDITAKSILIVGSGIVGAAAAYHLARSGATVTVLEREEKTGGLATPASWAWINASFFNAEPYARFRFRAMAEWHALALTVPGLSAVWPGSLLWDKDAEGLARAVASHAAWGYDCHMLSPEAAGETEPSLIAPPGPAAFSPAEGVVNPIKATATLLQAAERLGTRILTSAAATGFLQHGTRITGLATPGGTLLADEVLLCAGTGTNDLLATLGLRLAMTPAPGLVVLSHPVPPMLRHLIITPALEVRQDAVGRVIAAGDMMQGDADDGLQSALLLFDAVRAVLRGGSSLRLAKIRAARRPMPTDGLPILGRIDGLDGLCIAATHSGVTLAPLLGRLLADDILYGNRDPDLAPFGVANRLG